MKRGKCSENIKKITQNNVATTTTEHSEDFC